MSEPIRYIFDLWIMETPSAQVEIKNSPSSPCIQSIPSTSFKANFFIDNHFLTAACQLKTSGSGASLVRGMPTKNISKVRTSTLFEVSAGFVSDLERQDQRVRTAVLRVKKGEEFNISIWQSAMHAYKDQAHESILREQVLSEHWFSFELDDRTYLFATMIEGTSHVAPRSRLAGELLVDELHKQFKLCWDRSFVGPAIRFK